MMTVYHTHRSSKQATQKFSRSHRAVFKFDSAFKTYELTSNKLLSVDIIVVACFTIKTWFGIKVVLVNSEQIQNRIALLKQHGKNTEEEEKALKHMVKEKLSPDHCVWLSQFLWTISID